MDGKMLARARGRAAVVVLLASACAALCACSGDDGEGPTPDARRDVGVDGSDAAEDMVPTDVDCLPLNQEDCIATNGCVVEMRTVRHHDDDRDCNAPEEVPVCHRRGEEWGCGNRETMATDTPGDCYRFFASSECIPAPFVALEGEQAEACLQKIENASVCP